MRDRIENSVDVRRPVTEVFRYVVTPAHWPQWAGPVIAVGTETQAEPLRPEEEFTVVSKLMGKQIDAKYRVTELEENRILQYATTSGPLPHQFTVTFASVPDGTRVTQTVEADPAEAGGFFKLAYPLVKKAFSRQAVADLATLKDLLEAQA
jgi:uncharacterized protein YndB with AHSA1/START domain